MAEQKSLSKSIGTFFSNFAKKKTWYGLFNSATFNYTDYEKRSGLDLYKISLYLNKALDKRAEKIGSTEWIVRNTAGDVIEYAEGKGEADWIYKLFAKPNSLMTGKEFFSTLQKQKDANGKAYVLIISEVKAPELEFDKPAPKTDKKKKPITEMHLLAPECVVEKYNQELTQIVEYEYHTSKNGTIKYKPEQIIRIVRIDPANPLQAESLIQSGRKAISVGIQLDDYQSNVLRNGGAIKGIMKYKGEALTKEQIEEQKDRYKEQYAGADKAGIPLFIGGDCDYQSVGLNPEEIGYLQSKNANLNDICILTGVPKSILGNFDEIKYDNADSSIKIFLKEVITPQAIELGEAFNWTIIPEDMDLDFVPFVDEEKEAIQKTMEVSNNSYCLTTNEKRKMVSKISGQDLPDVEGGDEILAPFSLTPISSISEPSKDTPEEEPEEKAVKVKSFKPILKEEMKVNYAETVNKYIDKRAIQLQEGVVVFAKHQEDRIMKLLGLATKGKSKVKLELDGEFDVEVGLAIKFITPYLEEFISDAGNGALDLLGIDKPLAMTERMKKVIEKKAKFYAKTTTKTTFKELEDTLSIGAEANETINQLTDRVKVVFNKLSTSRAELIARTEATTANNDGLLEAYRQSGVATGKEWIAVMDDRTRPEHAMLNGEIVGLSENFSNGLPYPQEFNCRCVIGPALEE
jgi:HK97 family phage portal protein